LAEHLLAQFHPELPGGVHLLPSRGGVFEVSLGDQVVFSKRELGRFPTPGEVEIAVEVALGRR
jgi:selenoprotein W-related protein